MKEQILIRGKAVTGHRAFRCFGPAGCLWALTFLFAQALYSGNVNGCHYSLTEAGCFPEWEYSFWEFMKLSMGPNTFFVSLTLLIWISIVCLAAGIFLFYAFRNNEITVTDRRVQGMAAFGTRVQVSLPDVLDAEPLPGHCLKLSLFSGSLIFGGVQNQKEVCRIIRENLILQEERERKHVQIASRGISSLKLAVLCALPFVLLFLPILLMGEPSLGKAWGSYWRTERFQERFSFLMFWLVSQMDMGKTWSFRLGCAAFPALLAGGFCFYGCSCQKIVVTANRVRGRAAFRAAFDLPLSEITRVKRGHFGSLILQHSRGKLRILCLKNRQEVLQVLETSFSRAEKNGEASEAPRLLESRTVSDRKLGLICFLPLTLFILLFSLGIGTNAEFCSQIYEQFESIQRNWSFLEYLLISALAENQGRWIKAFFWLSLPGIAMFHANRSQMLTLSGNRVRGRSRFGGCLDLETEDICGVSISTAGSLTLYTDSGKFVFGCLKNRKSFYDFFCEQTEKL